MQRRRHRPDDIIADKYREREDRQSEHERIDRAARGGVASRYKLVAVGLRPLSSLARCLSGGSEFFNRGVKVVHRLSPALTARKRLLRHEVWVNNRAATGEAGRLHQLVVPVDGERLVRLVDQRFREGVKV